MFKVTLSCIGRFHHFDLARQLYQLDVLDRIYTGYPRWKLKQEGVPTELIDTYPWLHAVYMSQSRWPVRSVTVSNWMEQAAASLHDWHVCRVLRKCDVFVGLSGHNTKAGRRAQELGAKWVCDRGSSHIAYQNRILVEEHARWGVPFAGVPKWAIANEEDEYARCDLITVPSGFAERTFIEAGIPSERVRRVPYGVDLSRFHSVAEVATDRFEVCFVGAISLQKGVPYLVEAFLQLRHPRKRLRIIGGIDSSLASWVRSLRDNRIEFMGHVPQTELKNYLSRTHVFVLPSIQDGFGMVMAQAMACGCPVIATENSGGPDLISNGVEGWVVPIRDSKAIADAMQILADNPELRQKMGQAALVRVAKLGGWSEYGSQYIKIVRDLCDA